MAGVGREEFNEKEASQDEKLNWLVGEVRYIRGKVDGKNDSWTAFGVIGAIVLGLANMFK